MCSYRKFKYMSNFRIKKTPGSKSIGNMKDSNTLEKKHRQKVKALETKKNSLDKIKKNLKKVTLELQGLEEKRNNNVLIDLEKRGSFLPII